MKILVYKLKWLWSFPLHLREEQNLCDFILLVALLNATHFGRRKFGKLTQQCDNHSDSFLIEKSEKAMIAMHYLKFQKGGEGGSEGRREGGRREKKKERKANNLMLRNIGGC